MNKLLTAVATAVLVFATATGALAAAECNCAAGTCKSGGMTWPISSCAECVCPGASYSVPSATNPWSRPVDSRFLRENYVIPTPGGTTPLDTTGTLTPIEEEKKRKLLELEMEELIKQDFENRRKEAEKAEKEAQEAKKQADAAKQKALDLQELQWAAQKLGTENKDVIDDLEKRFNAAVLIWNELDVKSIKAARKAKELRLMVTPPAPRLP